MTGPAAGVLILTAEDSLPNSNVRNANRRYRFPHVSPASRPLSPQIRDDHLRVEMLYAGVCGTDLHLVGADPQSGYVLTSSPTSIPPGGRVIGHEGVGRIVDTGAAAGNPGKGAIVAFASILACLHCDICRRGDFNQCRHSRLLGAEIDGIFGTVVDVPAALAHDVSDMVRSEDDLRAAACIEPAGVALLACEAAHVRPGDRVVVFGGGPIGAYCAMLCKRAFGAAEVDLVEPIAFRRDLARKWCDQVFDVEEYFAGRERPADVVFECSGEPGNVERVFEWIAPNGRVILLGRSGKALSIAATDHMITNAISVAGCRGHLGGALGKVIALYRAGLLPLHEIVTGEVNSLEELATALAEPHKVAEQHCKLLIRFGAGATSRP
jgi:threonine dehydrogenase-like Zn-dependent dehydrogenase